MNKIVNLRNLKNRLLNLGDVHFCDVITYPSRMIIVLKIIAGDYHTYLDGISENLNISRAELDSMISSTFDDAGFKNGLFRISIPMMRLRKGCYCAYDIKATEEEAIKGDLIINDTFAQFPIELNEIHRKRLSSFLWRFNSILKEESMDSINFASSCPEITGEEPKGNSLCIYCIKTEQMFERGIA